MILSQVERNPRDLENFVKTLILFFSSFFISSALHFSIFPRQSFCALNEALVNQNPQAVLDLVGSALNLALSSVYSFWYMFTKS